jgi:TolB-like protein/DNA-binding SARP family transcriptional activator/Tfp pilus assembly protein PilF
MKPPARIRLRLLGRLALAYGDEQAPIRLSTRKAGALLAYVAMSPEQTASREELATLLWGSCSDQQARQSLRQALALLRKGLRWSHFFLANSEVVRLQPGVWSVDAREFDAMSKSSDPVELARAAELFGGEFLTGLNIEEEGFEEWLRGQRQRVQLAAARLCETLATRPDLVTDGDQAVAAAERLLALDPLREDWQRLALTLYARYRGKNEALAQAEAFAGVLQRELGVAPEQETCALIERIRAEQILPAASPQPARNPPASPLSPVATPATHGDELNDGPLPVTVWPSRTANQWPRRAMVATLAIVAIAAAGAIFALTNRASVSDQPVPSMKPTQVAAPNDYWRSPPSRDASAPAVPRGIIPIAVLPFTPLGDTGTSMQLIADMMTDDLIDILSRVPSFRVISRQTIERYRDRPFDIAAIGSELRVKYVLEGSARLQDGVLRVNIQLLDPATRLPVWSGRVEREAADRYAVRDEMVARVARELQVDILPIEGQRRSADQNADASAYLGWAAMQRAFSKTSIDDYREAADHLKQALARDPQHFTALMGLGAYHANLAVQRLDADTEAHFKQAEEILTGVMRRDPGDARAHHHLGILYQGSGRLREGLALFEKAVELNPSSAGSHAHIGHALARMGRAEEGIEHIHYAMRLSPKDPALAVWHEFLGNAHLEMRRYPEAIESFRQSATLAPQYPRPWAGLVAAYALSGDTEGARANSDQLRKLTGDIKAERLIERFGRGKESRLREGLRLGLVPLPDPWQSPALPSQSAVDGSRGRAGGTVALAVLPFSVAAEGGEAARLVAEVMTDDLINVLSHNSGLRVISRQSSGSYRGLHVDAAAAGAELGVRYVLSGSAGVQGDIVRLHVELIDATSRTRVWSGDFERTGSDRRVIQDEVVNGLGRELSLAIARTEDSHGPAEPDTHQLIIKGWSALYASTTAGLEALKRAEALFSEALARDPENPRALTGLGAYHVNMAVQLFAPDPSAHLENAEAILRRVIERHPNASDAHQFMGVLQIARGQGDLAIAWLEKAIALNPSLAPAYAQLGRMLTRAGNPDQGLKHVLYAMRLSPRDPGMTFWLGFAGAAELERKNYAKAVEYLDRAVLLHPKQPRNLLVRVAAHALTGNLTEARTQLEHVRKLHPHLTGEKLIDRFFGGQASGPKWPQLKEGLRLALADPWQSPPLGRDAAAAGKPAKSITAIAVLPFAASGETAGSSQLIADMLTDDLINILSRNRSFRVISRQTVRGWQDKPIDIAAMSAELRVRYVLEGSLRMQGDRLRVNVELIDSASRLVVWSGRVERDGADRYSVQDEIVARLARELQFEILPIESERRAHDPDADALAYRGWAAMTAAFARTSAEAFKRAEELFLQALQRDPQHLSAKIGLGAYHANAGAQALDGESRAHLDKAREILLDVTSRQPGNGGAHFYLGLVHGASGKLEDAVAAFTRAVEENPSHAAAHAHIGHALARMERASEGLEHLHYAIRLSPRDPNLGYWLEFVGSAEVALNRYQAAIENFRRSAALNPGYPRSWAGLAAAHALAGNIGEARRHADKLRTFAPQLDTEALIRRFGRPRQPASPLHNGLRLALTPGEPVAIVAPSGCDPGGSSAAAACLTPESIRTP